MTRFSVRIDLHQASWENYAALFAHLAGFGFREVIATDQGTHFRLPLGEYDYEGALSRDQVAEAAKICAAKVTDHYSLLVTASAGRTWYGLPNMRQSQLTSSAYQHQSP